MLTCLQAYMLESIEEPPSRPQKAPASPRKPQESVRNAQEAARGAESLRKPQKAAGGRQEAAQDAPENPSTTKFKLHAGMDFFDVGVRYYGHACMLTCLQAYMLESIEEPPAGPRKLQQAPESRRRA